ncbi:MAG: 4Fe-4S dicluster domain-containing protein [Cytophagales bacterium]|nr:4Fe-4S dicluster domain-containing protein [Cytophagales bacterium]
MEPTREIYRNFPDILQYAFYLIAFLACVTFIYGFYRKYKKYRKGKDANRFNNLLKRFLKAGAIMGKNSTVFKRDHYAGFAHWLIFWGFVVLLIGTAIVAIDHDFLRFLGIHLLEGSFYLWFSVILDVFGVLFILGLIMMIVRRAGGKPQFDYSRSDLDAAKYNRKGYSTDDKIFLWLLLLIGISGFVIEGLRISADGMPAFEQWSPVGWMIADLFNADTANTLHLYSWWGHAVMVMIFIAYIPYSKAMHMLIDYANLMFKDDMAAKKLARVSEEQQDISMGYVAMTDFTWKELMDFDACTKCGRCHVACPANAAGTPLSPRDVILDMRSHSNECFNTSEWFKQSFAEAKKEKPSIAGDVISTDRLWSCTTCMACVEACPVGINHHLDTIVNLRRTLVEEGDMDDMLQDALANIGDYGNSFGQSERMRAKWTSKLDFKIKDVRKEPAEFMWFVGDFASYDAGIQDLTVKVAEVMTKAGVDFGILYEGEKNSGNDIRRAGEEGLFEMMAEDNIETFSLSKFKEIFTTDPHSYNTIKNEYPEFGGNYAIYHYSGLLLRLHEEGKLKFTKKLDYKVTYHDPCYLGRYNGETEAPRKLLEAMGVELIEMPRCKENSFCCGAGGGRVWMDDSKMEERPSEIRIKEAVALGSADHFIVCCPKDYSMFSDAVKTTGNEDRMEVKDIIQLVEEAMG